jgi:two-component system response regulator FlrC
MESADTANTSPSAIAIQAGMTVKEMEKKLITKTLQDVDDNRTRAAELLGISIRTLRNKLKEYKQELQASQAESATQSG